MNIDPIMALGSPASVDLQGISPEVGGADLAISRQGMDLGGFGSLVSHGMGAVNQDLMAAQADLQQLATGNVQNLHQIMIRLEESRLSFQLFMQVRNRLLEAYQDVMKMQV